MPVSSYDIVVLGDSLAGLMSATLCARRGLRVLVVGNTSDRSPAPPGEALPFAGLSSPAVERVLAELSLKQAVSRRLDDVDRPFQYVGPDLRIDVSSDDRSFRRELTREASTEGAVLRATDAAAGVSRELAPILSQDVAVPPTGFWERREVGRFAGPLAEQAARFDAAIDAVRPELRPLFSLPALLSCHAGPDHLTAVARARAFDLWRKGVPRLRGDVGALRQLLQDKLTTHSGEWRRGRAAELRFQWNRVTGVRLEDDSQVGAEFVIAALPVDELALLCGDKLNKRLQKSVQRLDTAAVRYTLHLSIDPRGIPMGMGKTVLVCQDPSAPLAGANAFAIYTSDPEDDQVLVTIEALCPRTDRPLDDALQALRVALLDALDRVMPFYRDHVTATFSPHERPTDGDNRRRPSVPPKLWGAALTRPLALSAQPYTVGVKQLALASTQNLGGLGLEGQFAVALSAAKLACGGTGKRKDLLKNEVISGAAAS